MYLKYKIKNTIEKTKLTQMSEMPNQLTLVLFKGEPAVALLPSRGGKW